MHCFEPTSTRAGILTPEALLSVVFFASAAHDRSERKSNEMAPTIIIERAQMRILRFMFLFVIVDYLLFIRVSYAAFAAGRACGERDPGEKHDKDQREYFHQRTPYSSANNYSSRVA
jgi:hypothetical protein